MDVNEAIRLMHTLKVRVYCTQCNLTDPPEEILKIDDGCTEVHLHKDCPNADILRVPLIKKELPPLFSLDQCLDACYSIIALDQQVHDIDKLFEDARKQIEDLKALVYKTP